MFLSLGVLQLAYQSAGCPQNENGSYINCGEKVYGMLPSDILAMMALVGGLSTAAFMPYAGAVVDFSDHRLTFGRVCAVLLVLTNVAQIFIFPSTWFAMVIAQSFIAASTFMANSMVMWSYVNAPSDHVLHGITASGRLWETIGMLGFFVVVGVVQFTSGWDSVSVARFSQALASVVGGVGLFLAYKRYEPVKAVKTLESGKSLYIAGIVEIAKTAASLWKTEPSAFVFLMASIFNEAAISSFTNLSITYLAEQLQMSSTSIVIFIMINFVTNPLGVLIHRLVNKALLCFLVLIQAYIV
jgi:MFS-type transporter involved in bile tolerance (Atg22 family)